MKKGRRKFFKRFILTSIILLFTLFFLRGTIYRTAIEYRDVGARKVYTVEDKQLAKYIEENLPDEKFSDIYIAIDRSQRLTNKSLSYSPYTSVTDPNRLHRSKKATCVGYATYMATTANYMMDRLGYDKSWEAMPRKGHLYIFGVNIHQYFSSKMFKDHDFVIFRNKINNIEIYVDPTVSDYLWINRVSKYEK